MNTTTHLRRFSICALLIATLGLAVFTGRAAAQAVPGTFTHTEPVSGPDVDLCTGQSGFTAGTVTEQFHFIDMPDGTSHVELTVTLDYRTDWSDGTYLIAHSVSHNEFQTSPSGEAEFTFAQQDRGTTYSSDGRVIGYRTVFTQGHVTWNNGTVITGPSQFRVTCR